MGKLLRSEVALVGIVCLGVGVVTLTGCGGGGAAPRVKLPIKAGGQVKQREVTDVEKQLILREVQQAQGKEFVEVDVGLPQKVIAPVNKNSPADTPQPTAIILPDQKLIEAQHGAELDIPEDTREVVFNLIAGQQVGLRMSAPITSDGTLPKGIVLPSGTWTATIGDRDGALPPLLLRRSQDQLRMEQVIFQFDVDEEGVTSLPNPYTLSAPVEGAAIGEGFFVELILVARANDQPAEFFLEHTGGRVTVTATVSNGKAVFTSRQGGPVMGRGKLVKFTTKLP